MQGISIRLFGSMQITVHGFPVIKFATEKERALLAYLVIERNTPIRREFLGSLFWPDRPESAARRNVRQALYQLRKTIGECDEDIPHLLTTVEIIQFDPGGDYWLDVEAFNHFVTGCQEHHAPGDLLCAGCLERLETAVDLYRGDILADFSLPDCSKFEWWQFQKQETYRRKALDALSQVARYHLMNGNFSRAASYAYREIEIEPWRESAHTLIMQSLFFNGERAEALRQYEICYYMLAKELDIEPCEEMKRTFMQIRDGSLTLEKMAG